MEITNEFVLETWTTISEFIPAKQKEDAAVAYLSSMEEYGVDSEITKHLKGEDEHLDKAMEFLYEEELEELDELEDDY